MKIVAGLGNPGPDYMNTRHNAGSMLVERIATGVVSDYGWRRHKEAMVCETAQLILVKTAGKFMNESGVWVKELLKNSKYSHEQLYLAHDDLDLRLGEYKVQLGVGPKIHYGVQSVEQYLGTKTFWRIRIGIDNRDPANRANGEQYVLEKFPPAEKEILERVLDEIAKGFN